MSTGNHRFRQSEITRAVKALEAAGHEICGVEITADGKIKVLVGKPGEQGQEKNVWDEVYGKPQTKVR